MMFRRRPLILTPENLQKVCETVRRQRFGLVLIASWQAVVRGLIRDENDNGGAVRVVEDVKAAARQTGIPWLIDAHSGKGEDQADDADPTKAMRGASAAAGAADYTLSLRYANGTFGSQRRLSGKGRFVSFAPMTLDFNPTDSSYTLVGTTKDATRETTWRLICETGAINSTPRSVAEVARTAGLLSDGERLSGHTRQRITDALRGRDDVLMTQDLRRGQKTTLFYRV